MGLIKCPECGNNVSRQAEKCPHCGIKLSDIENLEEQSKAKEQEIVQSRNLKIFGIILILIVFLVIGINYYSEYKKKKQREELQTKFDTYNSRLEEGRKKVKELDELIDNYEKANK